MSPFRARSVIEGYTPFRPTWGRPHCASIASKDRPRSWSRLAPSVYFLVAITLFVALIVAEAIWVPEASWVKRHVGGIGTALFLGLMALLFFLLARRQSAGGPAASQAAAPKDNAGAAGRNRGNAKRAVSGR